MKAIQIQDKKPQLIELPKSADEGVLIKVAASSICGSDLHLTTLGWADGVILGHEFAGHTPDGTAVAVEPVVACGECLACEEGYTAVCHAGPQFYGTGLQGGMAEYVTVPANNLCVLPTGMNIQDASLVEPISVGIHGVNRATIQVKSCVLVIGGGPIGLAVAAVLNARGYDFDIVARHSHQQNAAVSLGGNLLANATERASYYDVVLDCVGTADSLREATHAVRPRGVVTVLGTFWQPVPLDMGVCTKDIDVRVSMGYRCGPRDDRTFAEAAKLLFENSLIADSLISHRFPLDGAAEAFAVAMDRKSGTIKVAFDLTM